MCNYFTVLDTTSLVKASLPSNLWSLIAISLCEMFQIGCDYQKFNHSIKQASASKVCCLPLSHFQQVRSTSVSRYTLLQKCLHLRDLTIKLSTVFYNSTKKRQHYFDILKAFFVRQSSEYKTSDSDRKVNRNIYPDAVTRDRMRLIDPKSGQLEPNHHCCLVEEL